MAKAVLISIRPEWVEKIANKLKTIEVRKTKPYLETPFKCYIYCTNKRPFLVWGDVFRGDWFTEFTHLSGYGRSEADKIWDVFNGHVVGEFVCDTYVTDKTFGHDTLFNAAACMSESDMVAYSAGTPLYGWHISNLEIYDGPKQLNRFKLWNRECKYNDLGFAIPNCGTCQDCIVKKPPQSWCYVEELKPEGAGR